MVLYGNNCQLWFGFSLSFSFFFCLYLFSSFECCLFIHFSCLYMFHFLHLFSVVLFFLDFLFLFTFFFFFHVVLVIFHCFSFSFAVIFLFPFVDLHFGRRRCFRTFWDTRIGGKPLHRFLHARCDSHVLAPVGPKPRNQQLPNLNPDFGVEPGQHETGNNNDSGREKGHWRTKKHQSTKMYVHITLTMWRRGGKGSLTKMGGVERLHLLSVSSPD